MTGDAYYDSTVMSDSGRYEDLIVRGKGFVAKGLLVFAVAVAIGVAGWLQQTWSMVVVGAVWSVLAIGYLQARDPAGWDRVIGRGVIAVGLGVQLAVVGIELGGLTPIGCGVMLAVVGLALAPPTEDERSSMSPRSPRSPAPPVPAAG